MSYPFALEHRTKQESSSISGKAPFYQYSKKNNATDEEKRDDMQRIAACFPIRQHFSP
jgi:hypothetical protein